MDECLFLPFKKNRLLRPKRLISIHLINSISYMKSREAFSKIEKWFEVKPPAPLPGRRVGPTPRRGRCKDLKNPDHRPGILLSRPQGRQEIGPSMLLRVVSLSNEPFSLFEKASY
jgi:hypothetical protein